MTKMFVKTVTDALLMPRLTFVVKSVNSVDGGTLMVSSQQEEVLGIFYLKNI